MLLRFNVLHRHQYRTTVAFIISSFSCKRIIIFYRFRKFSLGGFLDNLHIKYCNRINPFFWFKLGYSLKIGRSKTKILHHSNPLNVYIYRILNIIICHYRFLYYITKNLKPRTGRLDDICTVGYKNKFRISAVGMTRKDNDSMAPSVNFMYIP